MQSFFYFTAIIGFIGLSEFIYQLSRPEIIQAIIIFLWVPAAFFIPVFVFQKYIKAYLFLLIPVFLTIPLNIIYIVSFANNVSMDLMLLFLNTNKDELLGLLSHYYLILLVVYIIYGTMLWFLYRRIPNAIPSKMALYVSIAGAVVYFTCPFLDNKYGEMNYYDTMRTNFTNVYPTSMLKGIHRYLDEKRVIAKTQKDRDAFKFEAKADTSIKDKQVIILVVGESSRYYSWGINGYTRNTSPKLAKRQNLISFTNTVAGAYATENAVPLILTGVGAANFESHYYRKGILGAFGEAGYDTYWISNQPGDKGNIKVHAIEAQHEFHMMGDKNTDKDLNMMDQFKKIMDAPGNKKFIVIHTMGSHFDYSDRYPDSYDFFKPSNKTVKSKVQQLKYKHVMVNSYDNSIRYSDAVLDSIIHITSNQNNFASVVYLSDHGEDLLDDKRNLNYHMNALPPSKYVTHIPLFVWYSSALQKKYPEKITNLLSHKDAATSSQNVIYTVTSLAGIKYPKQFPDMDITSPGFKDNPQLFLGEAKTLFPYSICK